MASSAFRAKHRNVLTLFSRSRAPERVPCPVQRVESQLLQIISYREMAAAKEEELRRLRKRARRLERKIKPGGMRTIANSERERALRGLRGNIAGLEREILGLRESEAKVVAGLSDDDLLWLDPPR